MKKNSLENLQFILIFKKTVNENSKGIAFPTLDKITIAKSQVLVYNES